jgi:hypothetical protein
MKPRVAMLALAALLLGCPGNGSVPVPGQDSPWPGSLEGNSFGADSAWVVPTDGGTITLDSAGPDSGPMAGCPHGNLLATLPTLPPLCSPFTPPQKTAPTPDPGSCQASPKVTLSSGDDQFTGTGDTKDDVRGMDGDDTLRGMACSDWLNGNTGSDWLNGNTGNDTVRGGADDDTIHGGAGNDVLHGDSGNDLLFGDDGDDQYVYATGDGHDVIEETGGHDQIVCATSWDGGLPRPHLQGWKREADDLVLLMSGNGSIRVKQFFTLPERGIELIVGCQ